MNPIFTRLPDEWAWSKAVKKRDTLEGTETPSCRWPGCSRVGTDAAHAFGRWNKELSLALEDGLTFCRLHHRKFDELVRVKKHYAIKMFVGEALYCALRDDSARLLLHLADHQLHQPRQ